MVKAQTRQVGGLSKSEQMARVRSRNTKPEMLVRKVLSSLGVRYRLHRKELPGCPDLYVGRLQLAVFVNGCFWHGHQCARGKRPKTNIDFWNKKIQRNKIRDRDAVQRLERMGVDTLTFWGCDTASVDLLCRRIARRYKSQKP